MGLRVISTKLSEEEHNRITELCKLSNCNLSTFLKQCIMELMEKEETKVEKPEKEINFADELTNKKQEEPKETKIAARIRYQYF